MTIKSNIFSFFTIVLKPPVSVPEDTSDSQVCSKIFPTWAVFIYIFTFLYKFSICDHIMINNNNNSNFLQNEEFGALHYVALDYKKSQGKSRRHRSPEVDTIYTVVRRSDLKWPHCNSCSFSYCSNISYFTGLFAPLFPLWGQISLNNYKCTQTDSQRYSIYKCTPKNSQIYLLSFLLWIFAISHLRRNRSVYTHLKTVIPLRPHKLFT